jgi:hypothetical protein
MHLKLIVGMLLMVGNSHVHAAQALTSCNNLVKKPYNASPAVFAPDDSRGKDIQIWLHGALSPIPDTRAGCLPIPLRYNNPGSMKTPSTGPWPNQMTKDQKGHAVFPSIEAGIAAWGLWMKRKYQSGHPQSAMSIMSVYAPETDCVGSIGTPPNCPYGVNPTREYAARVASSVGKQPNDPLNLDGMDCGQGREALYALLQQIATFEIGGDFCGREKKGVLPLCVIDRGTFDRAMDTAYGLENTRRCAK